MLIKSLSRAVANDERGNVAIIFCAAAIPLLLLMGGAVDLNRYTRYKAELSNAVDAGALALARKTDEFQGECKVVGQSCPLAATFVSNFVAAYSLTDDQFAIAGISVTRSANGFVVTANADMATAFLPIGSLAVTDGGINSMDVDVTTGVTAGSNRLELALVLDNTGSMNCASTVTYDCAEKWASPETGSKIAALKSAAKTLVNTLMKGSLGLDDPNQIRIALVPFEGTVNVASTDAVITNPPSWIDWNDQGKATYSGANFDKANNNNKNIGHKLLFDKLKANAPTIKWGGCVEMRAGSYELSDAAPSTSTPDSLFVPYFWPDEPDSDNNPSGSFNNNNGNTYTNNYLRDTADFRTSNKEDPVKAQSSVAKYNSITWISSTIKTEAVASYTSTTTYPSGTPFRYGPNKGCPRPIVPLVNADGKATLLSKIDGMLAYWSNGTFIPVGLMWGWHVLSPELPYTEGIASTDPKFDKTIKAIVLLTDGDNDVAPGGTKANYYSVNQNNNKSRYSAYGYVAKGRLASTETAAADKLDEKTATLCADVKAKNKGNIRLYTISFGTLSTAAKKMLSDCATVDDGSRLYYHAPTSADLEDIFTRIGEDLSNLHLSM